MKITFEEIERQNAIVNRLNYEAELILRRFVEKVESGKARSTETYQQAKKWLASKEALSE